VPSKRGNQAGSADALRTLALVAMAICVTAMTAAACALSYASVHQLATEAGVSVRLARIYPLVFDAMLVLTGCAVLALRGAGLISRLYSWLCFLLLLASLAAAGAVRAAGTRVPRHPSAIAAAVIPFVLVLAGFGLLMALLRHAQRRRAGRRPAQLAPAGPGTLPDPAGTAGLPDPAGSDPAGPDLPGQDPAETARLPVRQADLQLRARTRRQSASDSEAGTPGSQVAGVPPAPHHPPRVLPPIGAATVVVPPQSHEKPTNPRSLRSAETGPDPAESPAAPAGQPPALQRQHSSPTPPEG
jgi:uncharacterized membrane protein SirB2